MEFDDDALGDDTTMDDEDRVALVEGPAAPDVPVTIGPPRHLSPSSASTFTQCPRRWRHRYVDRLPDPPGEAALVGSFAHRVLELLLGEPAEVRTIARAKELARIVWPETEADPHFVELGLDDEARRAFRWKGWLAIEGLWLLEDPGTVLVESTEQQVDTELAGVPFRGIVDRLERCDGDLVVTDYKSGRPPSRRYRDGRLAQVVLYAAAVEAVTGERPARARLLYLGQKEIDVAVDDDRLGPVLDDLGATWTALVEATDTDSFEARPGVLCGWCPYVEHCPEGRAEIEHRHEHGVLHAHAPAVRLVAAAT